MKLPYGYVLVGEEVAIHEENANIVRSIFEYYLAGASMGKIVDMLYAKGILSPSGNPKWGRAAVDKLLSNSKYIPIVGMRTYTDAQFERERRCNVDYDKIGHLRKSTRYQSASMLPWKWNKAVQILFFLIYLQKREKRIMTEKEVGELYISLAFQYESLIDSLLARQIIETDPVTTSREKFYDSLNEEKLRTSKKSGTTMKLCAYT